MDCRLFILTEFVLVSGGRGGQVGTCHVERDLGCAGAVAFSVGDGAGEGLCLLDRNGLCGLAVGIGDHVGRLPVVSERAFCAWVGSEGGNAAVLDRTRIDRSGSHGHSKDDHILRDFVFASATGLHRVSDLVSASGRIGVCHILLVTFFPVTEVPMIVGE